jgi:hypothetical protein
MYPVLEPINISPDEVHSQADFLSFSVEIMMAGAK